MHAIRRHPLAAYFVLAYAGSWLVWAPWWLARIGVGILPYELPRGAVGGVNALGLFAGPFAAAFIVTRAVEGREGVRRLWRRLVQVRAGWVAYALALVAIPLAIIVPVLFVATGRESTAVVPFIIRAAITGLAMLLLGGALAEEPGWRGFALPRLQERLHPLAAALLLGVLWCAWHAPLFLTREWDTPRSNHAEVAAYVLTVVALSVVMSWTTNAGRGSVFLAALAHNSVNVTLWGCTSVLVVAPSNVPFMIGMVALALVAVAVTRGRLAVERAQTA